MLGLRDRNRQPFGARCAPELDGEALLDQVMRPQPGTLYRASELPIGPHAELGRPRKPTKGSCRIP
jgi:hypothetical protein